MPSYHVWGVCTDLGNLVSELYQDRADAQIWAETHAAKFLWRKLAVKKFAVTVTEHAAGISVSRVTQGESE
jgi:hypothetical protein